MIKNWKVGAVATMAAVLMTTTGLNVDAATKTGYSRESLKYNKVDQKVKDSKTAKDYYKEGEVIVMYGDKSQKMKAFSADELGADLEVAETYSFDVDDAKAGAKTTGSNIVGNVHYSLIKSDKYTTKELMNMMKKRSDVKAVMPNWVVKSTGANLRDFQWALDENGTNAGVANQFIKENKSDGKEKVIAVVDTGVDYTHPDLADKMWTNPFQDQIKGEHGYDFINFDADPLDDNGHGTHCSGIAAGNYDESGISGIVDSDNVKIMALKMLDEDGYGEFMEEIGCYNYIYRTQQMGVNVVAINNSWSVTIPEWKMELFYEESDLEELKAGDEIFKSLADLVGENGAISCCAAGNDGENNDYTYSYPCNVDSDYIVSVAASTPEGDLASFSDYGRESVDLAAPGTGILSSVSYDNFEPAIYTEDKLKEVCANYEGFKAMADEDLTKDLEEGSISFDFKNAKIYNVENEEDSKVSVTAEQSFDKGGNSLKLTFSGVEEDGEYAYAIPFKAPSKNFLYSMKGLLGEGNDNPDSFYGGDILVHSVVKASEFEKNHTLLDGWILYKDSSWSTMTDECKFKEGEDLYLVVMLVPCGDNNVTAYLDDIAISKSTDDEFGKYAFYDGTSMATPAVTGAAAALAELNPEMSALERKEMLLGCVRPGTGSVATETVTGGILDLSKVKTPRMYVGKAAFVENSKIEITGNFLTGAKVLVNETEVKPTESTDKKIVIDAKDYINRSITVTVEKDGSARDYDLQLVVGEALQEGAKIEGATNMPVSAQMVTDGSNAYLIDQNGIVSKVDEEGQREVISDAFTADVLGKGYESYKAAGEAALSVDNNYVCLNGEIYAIAKLDSPFETKRVMVKLSEDNVWVKAADLPKEFENQIGITLGAYNGNVYLLGGINEAGDISTNVSCFNVAENKWDKVASLPSGRAFSKSIQSGNKLLVAFGAKDKEGTYPEILAFDGENWTASKASVEADCINYANFGAEGYTGIQFAAGSISAKDTEEGEIPVDGEELPADEDVVENATGLSIYYGNIVPVKDGIILQNMFVSGLGNIVEYNPANDTYKTTGYKTDFNYGGVGAVALNDKLIVANISEETIDLYSMPVESGMVSLDVTGEEFVDITKAQDAWLPCDTVAFTAKAKEGCEIESFTVAGKNIEANEEKVYSFADLASNNLDGVKVEVKGKAAKEEDPKKPATTEAPKPAKPATTEAPKKPATTQAPKPATTEAPKKAELPKVNSKVEIGNLVYKVTNSDAKNGTVSCVKYKNKKATEIVVPDTIKIGEYTFKVTKIADGAFASSSKLKSVTFGKNITVIGKNVCKKCKKLVKVNIKSSNIKSIGKGSFKSINKKATISVPKKMKKSYTKKLEKAGCKATVK